MGANERRLCEGVGFSAAPDPSRPRSIPRLRSYGSRRPHRRARGQCSGRHGYEFAVAAAVLLGVLLSMDAATRYLNLMMLAVVVDALAFPGWNGVGGGGRDRWNKCLGSLGWPALAVWLDGGRKVGLAVGAWGPNMRPGLDAVGNRSTQHFPIGTPPPSPHAAASSLQSYKVHGKAECVKTEAQGTRRSPPNGRPCRLDFPSRGWTAAASSRASAQPDRVACWPILSRPHHPFPRPIQASSRPSHDPG